MLNFVLALERFRCGLKPRSIEVDGETWHYLDGGAPDAPVVLLLHGFGGDKDNWTRMAAQLDGSYDLVIPDLPGHGESARIEAASYDIRSQVARIKALHDQLDLGPMHLAGNSMGGHISAAYAIAYPQDVLSISLLNPGGVKSPVKSELTEALERGHNPLLVEDVDDYDRLMDFVFVNPPWVPGPIKAYFAEQAVRLAEQEQADCSFDGRGLFAQVDRARGDDEDRDAGEPEKVSAAERE